MLWIFLFKIEAKEIEDEFVVLSNVGGKALSVFGEERKV